MKRIIFLLTAIFMCITAHAKTETINWYMDGNTYATTQCETGSDIILPQTPYKYGYTFNGWLANYTMIEYLESTGTQWIDTGVKGGLDSFSFNVKFSANYYNASQFYILGNFNQSGQSGIMFDSVGKHDDIVFTYYVANTPTMVKIGNKDDTLYISKKNNIIYFGNNSFEIPSNTSKLRNSNLCLYGTCIGTPYSALGKIYYLQIYDNDILVRDFIPVLDKNGVTCMFDKVERKFYYNAGTGDFIAGPVIGGE